jgi:acetyl-CoA C-acetyltransferase
MNSNEVRRVAVIGGSRIPFARAYTNYRNATTQDLMTTSLKGLVEKYHLQGETLGDVSLGAVIKHSSDWNLARESVLGSGLDPHTPAFDIQRACGTSLEAAILIGLKIANGLIDSGVGAGADSISDAPIVYPRSYQKLLVASATGRSLGQKLKPWLGLRPRHFKPLAPGVTEPRTNLSMGESCELMAKEWQISRKDQDQLAMESHLKAAEAQAQGWYKDQLIEYCGLDADNNVRANSSMESLAKLKPVFARNGSGTLTAGNSTPLTDGSSAVLLASEDWAREKGLPVQAYLTYGKTAAVDFVGGEGLLMAPTRAVSQMLEQAELELQDFDFYEIHEAFAAQALCTLKAWESDEFCREKLGRDRAMGAIDRSKMNVKGGSVAVGHPFGATGGRVLMTMAELLAEKGSGRGLISVCTGGGMGVTAILER